MMSSQYQKGKFYTLPVLGIATEGEYCYFKVDASGKEYLIRMFNFQKDDEYVRNLKQLPVMAKDVHGDNVVFVQNFAQMFGKDYDPNTPHSFIVQRHISTLPDGRRYYDIKDTRGVPFRLKTGNRVYLQPYQRINCRVTASSINKLEVEYIPERRNSAEVVSPEKFLAESGLTPDTAELVRGLFLRLPLFSTAREYLSDGNEEWAVKAILSVPSVWKWGLNLKNKNRKKLLEVYQRLSLYLLEESRYLMAFSDSERANFQEWIGRKVEKTETFMEVIRLVDMNEHSKEIDRILHKLRNSGFIYHPEEKMELLVAIFSLYPNLLEERIDTILDIIRDTSWSRRLNSFKNAFRIFMLYYIKSHRDRVNREAFRSDESSNQLLNRMVRAIGYLLLMSSDRDRDDVDVPLYKSILYHYLSFVRVKNVLGRPGRELELSDSLLERSFQALMSSDTTNLEFGWDTSFGQTEEFAYRMSVKSRVTPVLTTRSFESDGVRFTVSNDRITLAGASVRGGGQNILPRNILDWHGVEIYMENPNKFQISQYSTLSKWKEWWRKVETGLFERPSEPIRKKAIKMTPEVGTDVIVRVLRQDDQNRFYCRIEDDSYYGEGWLDVYGKGASTGLFHYEPFLDLSSFYSDGDPLLLRVRINAVQNANEEMPRFMFDAMGYLDDFVRDNCEYDARYNCKLIYHDVANKVIMGVTEVGFGVFVPETSAETEYGIGDCVTVRLTDTSNGKRIQAEVTGHAEEDVDVKTAAESLLLSYTDEQTYQESADELAEEAMSVSEDQFEPAQIRQLIHILDHKSILESNRVSAYGYISIAIVLARMAGDETMVDYLRQRQRMICVLDDFGKNGKVDEDEIRNLSDQNADQIERFPLLKQKLCQIQIVNSMGKQENNEYLWNLAGRYNSGHIIGKLSRLMLSYNMADGFGLQSHREEITDQIKKLLNINVKLPKIYSFGEEGQLVEFKSSIVFPPGNGMKADVRTQTFNILKVINGMVNSYGGTLYLGVYDTGTAKGLEDDLPFFDGSQDKFKLYVRNQIRLAMGNAVSAGIVEDTPDAGNHWIYSVKVRPSRDPVAMQFNGTSYYFFREGSSTYLYENLEEVKRVMDDRRLADYNMSETDMLAEGEAGTVGEIDTAENKKTRKKSGRENAKAIATGLRRRNVIQEWEEDYGVDVCGYFRIKKAGEWCHLSDTGYEDNLITVAINEKERNGSIVLVYEDGEVQRIPVADILRKDSGKPDRMRADKLPVFVCPAKEDSALLVAFDDTDGINYMRMDDISEYPSGRLTEEGRRIIDINMGGVTACEIVERDAVHKFSKIHNLNRRNLGTRTDHIYEKSLIEAAKEYGVI